MAKHDYSRLLDDEFLNAGERVRVRVVTRGAAAILGVAPSWAKGPSYTTLVACGLAAAMIGAMLTVLVCLSAPATIFTRSAPPQHPPPQPAALVVNSSAGSTTPTISRMVTHALRLHGTLNHENGDHDLDHDHDDDHDDDHDHEYDHSSHESNDGHNDSTDLHVAMLGGFSETANSQEDHPHGVHEHILPGDVVLEDHHILPAGDPAPTVEKHVLLLCLPAASLKAPANESIAPTAVQLTRAQRDVAQSAVEFLAGAAQCKLVVLRQGEEGVSTTAPPGAGDSTPSAQPLIGHTGCGSPDEDDGAGAEDGGVLELLGGRRLPVVLWDVVQLFARSPLAAGWQRLSTETASSGSNLMDLAGRLLLLWRYGGLSVNLDASADEVLRTMNAMNRSDTSHVYVETTRATVIAAPQTCNAIIFDLINTITKHLHSQQATTSAPGHEHYDSGDLRLFDDILNAYCRDRRPRSVVQLERVFGESNSTQSTSTTSTPPSRSISALRGRPRISFNLLKDTPPVQTTTPDPNDMRVDTTQCRHNLTAISLV